MFVAIASSYVLVALLGFVLGRIFAELCFRQANEAGSWPALPAAAWADLDPVAPYDWEHEESGVR